MPTIRIIDDEESHEEELKTNDQSLCNICQKQFANYVCPRCNLHYCSLNCYKDIQHADCTESFYKDSITEEIRSRGTSEEDKQNMLHLLRRFEAESDQQATTANSDDDEDEKEYMDDLHERFANIDLDNADEEAIWALLSEEERKEFESLLQHHHNNGDDSNIPLPEYHPWWKDEKDGFNKKVKIILQDDDHEEERNVIPKLPTPLPDLEAMMKSPPGPESDLIWSLMHTTMVYCYTMRHFLGDIREEIKDTISVVSKLCKSTLFSSTPGYAYGNPTEVLYHLVNDILDYEEGDSTNNSNNSRRTSLMLILLDDCLSLLENQDAVARAISDLWKLLEAGTKEVDKTNRRSFFLATRKSYFYLGYAVYISKNHGLERMKLLAMAERERLSLEEQSFDHQRKIAEQAVEMQQKQNKAKIINVL